MIQSQAVVITNIRLNKYYCCRVLSWKETDLHFTKTSFSCRNSRRAKEHQHNTLKKPEKTFTQHFITMGHVTEGDASPSVTGRPATGWSSHPAPDWLLNRKRHKDTPPSPNLPRRAKYQKCFLCLSFFFITEPLIFLLLVISIVVIVVLRKNVTEGLRYTEEKE